MTSTLDMLSTAPKHVMTVGDRSHFADLKDGSMIPGYKGYVPKYKFHEGYTYGVGTHEMYKLRKDQEASDPSSSLRAPASGTLPSLGRSRTLPPADGNNKLTEDMKPGYTGYVPRRRFIFGSTYRQECEECVDEFLGHHESNTDSKNALETVVASYPKLHPVTKDELVVRKLNHLRDYKDGAPAIAEDKRVGSEPPVPGYTGYVPRTGVTDLGLGSRYHISTEIGYKDFFAQSLQHASGLSQAVGVDSFKPQEIEIAKSQPGDADRRLYKQTGMLPKYTGYLPHEPYAFGKTYGNMTRSLSACTHEYPTYGLYKEDRRRELSASQAA